MASFEASYVAEHPEPELEHLPPGPDAPEGVGPELTPESEDRVLDWEVALEDAKLAH